MGLNRGEIAPSMATCPGGDTAGDDVTGNVDGFLKGGLGRITFGGETGFMATAFNVINSLLSKISERLVKPLNTPNYTYT